ncbi:hypothetical protein H6P81_019652 [Aristolochia fimbriata]|uniref:non-specific serine/threonine protein kinase n=1 Tax=Aristolochia fimbriata TaxID=158543 RepID=A0AAV7DVH4_ARIFI|nr:hypothetical protein H6P81_019652 [Aristolochia fimbriata]
MTREWRSSPLKASLGLPPPVPGLKINSVDGKRVFPSFSTTFVIAVVPAEKGFGAGNGMSFLLSPTSQLLGVLPAQYLGLFNVSNNGNSSNNITAIEFDTIQNAEFGDINDNHVGIDVNGLVSVFSLPAGYYKDDDGGALQSINLIDGNPLQVWVEYNETMKNLDVTLFPTSLKRPKRPLLSTLIDLSSVASDSVYVGFSAATGSILTSQYVLGWSFKTNGQAQPLNISALPNLPRPNQSQNRSKFSTSARLFSLFEGEGDTRFKIINQVASGLFFLHERWTQTVLHRDIKASNVLLDADFNGKLGDFGLSRLYDHGSDPHTTRLVGTIGYIAPELNRTGKATKSTDVYAFGIFLLEVVCGRRPMDVRAEEIMLVDWVSECFREGRILKVLDRKLQEITAGFGADEKEEMELVLKLGLLCSLELERGRPNMGLVMRYLRREEHPPEVPLAALRSPSSTATTQGSPNHFMSSPSLESNSLLVCGR